MLATTLLTSFILLTFGQAARLAVNGASDHLSSGRCEPISVPLCKNIPYNETIFPNLMGHNNQEEAKNDMLQYYTLIKVNCSVDIQLFVCSLYAPVCTILERPLPPCRSLCESARKCEKLMQSFGYKWPASFECSKFPPSGGADELCVGQHRGQLGGGSGDISSSDFERHRTTTLVPARPTDFSSLMNFVCPAALKVPANMEYRLVFGQERFTVDNCGAPCHKLFFGQSDIALVRQIIGVTSIFAFISCAFTLATFFIDMARFPYPEKPIIFLTFSYFVVSIVFLIGFSSTDDSIACNEPFTATSAINVAGERLLKQGTLHDWRCSVLGMLFYFFLMAGSLWWFILAVTWFLSAGLQWGQEAIDVKAAYLHGFVWTLASVQTTAVLVLKKIEGDILTGVCFVGILDEVGSLLVLVPLAVYLGLGFLFLLFGLVSLIRIRSIMKRDGTKTDKLEKLIGRIGCFSMLYMVPAGSMVTCLIYEYMHTRVWMAQWQEIVCRHPELSASWQVPCRYPDGQGPMAAVSPQRAVFLLKYFSMTMMGIFSGTWVWSGKTLTTWKMFYRRLAGLPVDSRVPTNVLNEARL